MSYFLIKVDIVLTYDDIYLLGGRRSKGGTRMKQELKYQNPKKGFEPETNYIRVTFD